MHLCFFFHLITFLIKVIWRLLAARFRKYSKLAAPMNVNCYVLEI